MDYGDHRLFLYDDIVDLVVTTNSLYVDNRPMNHRRLQAHKGLTNTIIFNIRNRDRKLQNVNSEQLTAYILNPSTRRRLLTKQLENTSDLGIVKLYLTNGDLQNVAPGLYRIYITRTNADQTSMPVYSSQDNDISFDIEITDQASLEPVETQESTQFTRVSGSAGEENVFTSSALYGNLEKNYQNAQHSIAIYTDAFTGNVKIQASCLISAPNSDDTSKDWFTVDTIQLTNSSGVVHRTFVVNCNWVRVLSYPAGGSITKVLLRN